MPMYKSFGTICVCMYVSMFIFIWYDIISKVYDTKKEHGISE